MPLLWRYIIEDFAKFFLLCVVAFIGILLTSRLEEIAHFASFGANLQLILFFTLLQIPYILPIAIPVGCLISASLLMQRLSFDHELSAIRSAGFSIKAITLPLFFTGILLALFNFYTVSELATLSHLKANLLKSELRSINPLLLLHNKHLMRVKGIFYDALGPTKMGQSATEVILAIPNPNRESLNLILAKNMEIKEDKFQSDALTIISPFGKKNEEGYENLLVENINHSYSSIENFSHLIQKKVSSISHDNLNMSLLLLRLQDYRLQLENIERNEVNEPFIKNIKKHIRLIYSEIARRFSAGLAPLTFILLGIAFGMSISRIKKNIGLFFPIALAALYLISFFAAKSLENQVGIAMALYLVPQLIIMLVSFIKLERIAHGFA